MLNGLVHIVDRNPLFEHLVAVNIDVLLCTLG